MMAHGATQGTACQLGWQSYNIYAVSDICTNMKNDVSIPTIVIMNSCLSVRDPARNFQCISKTKKRKLKSLADFGGLDYVRPG